MRHDGQLHDLACGVLRLQLALLRDQLGELRAHLAVDEGAQLRIAHAFGQRRLLGQVEVLDRQVQHRLKRAQLLEQRQRDLDRGRLGTVFLAPHVLDLLNVLAFLHLAGEMLLVRGGKEEYLADFAQVHTYRVVDALLVFQGNAALGRFALFFGFVGLLDIRLGPDVCPEIACSTLDHVRNATERVVAANSVSS